MFNRLINRTVAPLNRRVGYLPFVLGRGIYFVGISVDDAVYLSAVNKIPPEIMFE